ncbi:Zn-ribbon domain-containing OB-fold protein [Mycolicibacterium holsaticum]|uniref:Zn-ribbon domain-containing OB-fold protein n=1 Tax=Mycolicibacterium holsaticum TaxID=152142 RepID=UPI001E286023|nr:OB-fold domain-containing protein [Mycolicibacterium holsaticum]MDA4106813.1 hypothetical protein [Mycolicibacterium holsaticum DSM 44478 = JCM 12374]UNC12547.1 OB-fold domain-containing protein [Mycolicibacterium holsaticum DSM 44478 = JCM 12374]
MEANPSADLRPAPAPDDISGFYWNAAAEQRLVLQRCSSCHTLQYPPEVCCQRCQERNFELTEMSGQGVIYSYAVVDRPLHSGFLNALPYVVVLVELDEQPGLRILTNLIDVPEGTAVSCGMRVEVVYEERGSITLPQFRLSEAAG